MANAREINKRITSLGKTKQITRTMELVATARMKKTQDRLFATRPYAEKLSGILASMDVGLYREEFPVLEQREQVRRVAILLVSTNRGLCGGFNANLIRMARTNVDELKSAGKEVELHVIGKKGRNALRYLGYDITSDRVDITDWPAYEQAADIARGFFDRYVAGEIDEVRVIYAHFKNVASQPPTMETLLPLQVEGDEEEVSRVEFLLEPSPREILEALLPAIIENRVFKALLENSAGEQAARRIAMKNATDNADELIRLLTRSFNRARQAQITQELAEIVGGMEALA